MNDRRRSPKRRENSSIGSTQLRKFNNVWFDRGRSRFTKSLWLLLSCLLVRSQVPGSLHRRALLRAFGARIGRRVTVKPGVHVKFPWRLEIGDDSWIGENVWIDNLASVKIGRNCCISQGAYICTGSHDWTSATFDLVVKPVVIEDQAWIAAQSSVGPGVTVREGAVLSMKSLATADLAAWSIYQGVPAKPIKAREMNARITSPQ